MSEHPRTDDGQEVAQASAAGDSALALLKVVAFHKRSHPRGVVTAKFGMLLIRISAWGTEHDEAIGV